MGEKIMTALDIDRPEIQGTKRETREKKLLREYQVMLAKSQILHLAINKLIKVHDERFAPLIQIMREEWTKAIRESDAAYQYFLSGRFESTDNNELSDEEARNINVFLLHEVTAMLGGGMNRGVLTGVNNNGIKGVKNIIDNLVEIIVERRKGQLDSGNIPQSSFENGELEHALQKHEEQVDSVLKDRRNGN